MNSGAKQPGEIARHQICKAGVWPLFVNTLALIRKCGMVVIMNIHFLTNFKYWYLEHFLRNFPQVNVAVHFWCWFQLDLGNGLVPSGSKPLPKPMLTKFHDANQLDVNRILSSSKILQHAVQPFHILTNRQLEMSLEKTLKAKESSKKSV